MKTDDFEKRLQQVAPREVPSDWRAETLTAARACSSRREEAQTSAPTSRPNFLSTLIAQFSTSLRPHRAAWAGLAATWLVILTMNLASPEPSNFAAKTNPAPTPEILQELKQQKQLLAELFDRPAPHEADRINIVPTGPRSQRREGSVTV